VTHNQLLDNLQTELWDFYKDVHGVRPRHWTISQWDSVEFLQHERQALIARIERMTPQQKIEGGWGSNSPTEFEDFMAVATGPARS
jgi:hypothetical protein